MNTRCLATLKTRVVPVYGDQWEGTHPDANVDRHPTVDYEDETKNERKSKKRREPTKENERRSPLTSNPRKKSEFANAQAESQKSSVVKCTDKSIVKLAIKDGG